ncbi:MAG: IS110 family transposase [Chloroflexota bacterium]|nr:IS110 family transposase [Chloroflexota bacterium]
MRTIGLDIHKRFAEVAILEGKASPVRQRIGTSSSALRAFAQTLRPDDQVVLEATMNTWAIRDLLCVSGARVVVSNPLRTKAIAEAKAKTDKVDALTLAQLLAADFVPEVWVPDEETRRLRREVAGRAALVRQRTQARNHVHAVLNRCLADAPISDLFGRSGRVWLKELALPQDERAQVEATLRVHQAIEEEIALLDRRLAQVALGDERVERLMTIPGVGAVNALALVAVTGDVRRFREPGKLVSYLGLDPRVRLLERAVELAKGSPERELYARIQWSRMFNALWSGDIAGAMGMGEEALAQSRALGLADLEASTLNSLSHAYRESDRFADALAAMDRAAERFRELGNVPMVVDSLGIAAYTRYLVGDLDRLLSVAAEARRSADEIGHDFGRADVAFYAPLVALLRGDYAAALRGFEETLGFARAAGHVGAQIPTLQYLGQAYLELGELDRAEAMSAEASGASTVSPGPSAPPRGSPWRAATRSEPHPRRGLGSTPRDGLASWTVGPLNSSPRLRPGCRERWPVGAGELRC